LYKLILSVEDELVLCLDAKWGEGKTTFVRMWRGFLLEKGVKTIYFDAFKNDFLGEPFAALSAEIYGLAKDVEVREIRSRNIKESNSSWKSHTEIQCKDWHKSSHSRRFRWNGN
jgi:hypothetical protein